MTLKENKMGTWPENKLLLNMSVPIMISMLVQALYNIVDSYFVAQLPAGEDALTAVTLAFPIQNLMISVAVGTGVGINALLSRSLGEKRQDKANTVAMQGLFISFVWFLLFVLVGLFAARPFIAAQTTNEQVINFGSQYLTICCCCSLGVFMQVTMERLLQATGRTVLSMTTQGIGAIINIVLDPLLIFGLWGFPQMGIAGAAAATVIGQCVAACVGVFCNLKYNKELTLKLRKLLPNMAIIGQILFIGVPSIIMSAIGSVMTFSMNKILEPFAGAVAVFGVYFKLQSFAFMPVFGLNNGMVPIVAYNLGAKKRSRILNTIKLSALYASGIMLVGLLLMQLFPAAILGLFNASAQMLTIGVPAFRIISLCFVFAGVSIVMSSVCQAVGSSIYSMFVSIGRQLVILIPAAYLLSKTGDPVSVFWAFPIAE
ncbi:MAG: MATE family efflux transporter, partial [Clostridia bacterium]|nr:MATE family efflux transporter [Clostridia bacterium]